MYLAHKENEKKQELTVHLLEAGQYAQSEGEKIGIGTLATLCLQLHDAGKFSTEFQAYIKQEDDLPKRGAVNHSSAGAELSFSSRYEAFDRAYFIYDYGTSWNL